jgi:hypothetical protein
MRGRVFGKTLLRAGSPALGQSILRLTKSLRGSDLSDYGLKLVCWASEARRKAFSPQETSATQSCPCVSFSLAYLSCDDTPGSTFPLQLPPQTQACLSHKKKAKLNGFLKTITNRLYFTVAIFVHVHGYSEATSSWVRSGGFNSTLFNCICLPLFFID